ncbi:MULTISPECIES: hypothetical protein [unclassified Bradyrhizobium]|uniref:hypothetical protein n=1 Tax=unclassified Bradyrhizobium TaxID=2631580 RepID=UPI00102E5F2E|nr:MULTISPECIES: hypothetical protein [unclassified Bradyrhizobium]MDI4238785.1 hypothetical protein [Bradyrhizobium sp. Arg237L]
MRAANVGEGKDSERPIHLQDTTESKRELVGVVNAADMGEALLKAVSILARQKITSRVEIERTGRWNGDDLGHLSRAAELLASHVPERTGPCIGSAPGIYSPRKID